MDLLATREREARLRGEWLHFDSRQQLEEYFAEIDWDYIDGLNRPEPGISPASSFSHPLGTAIWWKDDFRADDDDVLRMLSGDETLSPMTPREVHQFRVLFRQLSRLSPQQLDQVLSSLSEVEGNRLQFLTQYLGRFELHQPSVAGHWDQDDLLQTLFSDNYFAITSFVSDVRTDVTISQMMRLENGE
jgi:hypothetical protein